MMSGCLFLEHLFQRQGCVLLEISYDTLLGHDNEIKKLKHKKTLNVRPLNDSMSLIK